MRANVSQDGGWAVVGERRTVPAQASRAEEGRRIRTPGSSSWAQERRDQCGRRRDYMRRRPTAGSQEWSGVLAEKRRSVRRLCTCRDATVVDPDRSGGLLVSCAINDTKHLGTYPRYLPRWSRRAGEAPSCAGVNGLKAPHRCIGAAPRRFKSMLVCSLAPPFPDQPWSITSKPTTPVLS